MLLIKAAMRGPRSRSGLLRAGRGSLLATLSVTIQLVRQL
jgi:hypothetical protein